MALPNSIDVSAPAGSDSPGAGDDQIRALKQFIEDLFGVPDVTSITTALFAVVAGGLDEVIFRNAAANPSAANRLRRNATNLIWASEDSRTNSVVSGFTIQATTDGTPAAGIGTGLLFRAESGDEVPSDFGRLDFAASDVGAGTEDTYLSVLLRVAGRALDEKYRFTSTAGDGFTAIFAHANSADRTYTFPDATETIVGRDTTDTLTNKTITAPVLSGTVTGTYTLGGTPTIGATLAGAPTASGAWVFSATGVAVTVNNDLRVNSQIFLNDNANAQQNVGITITDSGATARENITFKHSSLAHGVTLRTETDTAAFIQIQEWANGLGGLHLEAYRNTGGGNDTMTFVALSGSAGDTTKTASSEGRFNFVIGAFNGTDGQAEGANINMMKLGNFDAGTSKFLWDTDSEFFCVPASGSNTSIGPNGSTFSNNTDAAANQIATFQSDRATPAANDEGYTSFKLSDSAGNQDEFARLTWIGTDVTTTTEDGAVELDLIIAGVLTTTPVMRWGPGATVFINDNANANMSQGLTIKTTNNGNEIFALKDSNVAHGMTARAETDTYFLMKRETADGAVLIECLSSSTSNAPALDILPTNNLDVTTKLTTSSAIVSFNCALKSGLDRGAPGADANLLVIRAADTTRFIFDNEGSAHADIEWTTFDAYDDIAVLDDLERAFVPRLFGDVMKHDLEFFEAANILHDVREEGSGRMRGMLNQTRLLMLLTGAARQLGSKMREIEYAVDQRLVEVERRLN